MKTASLRATGAKLARLAKIFDTDITNVSLICRGKTWVE